MPLLDSHVSVLLHDFPILSAQFGHCDLGWKSQKTPLSFLSVHLSQGLLGATPRSFDHDPKSTFFFLLINKSLFIMKLKSSCEKSSQPTRVPRTVVRAMSFKLLSSRIFGVDLRPEFALGNC